MKIVLFANTDWFLYNYHLSFAKFLQGKGHEVILLSPHGPYVKELQRAGFVWQEISLSRKGMNPLREIKTIQRLRRIIIHINPDVLHNFTLKSVLYGSLAWRGVPGKKIINTITGMGYLFINGSLLVRMMRTFIKVLLRFTLKGTTVIFLNRDDRQFYLEQKIVDEGQVYLVNGAGIDTHKFHPAPVPCESFNIIFPARLLRDKGIYEFVEAARMVKKHITQARFILVGSIDEGNPSSVTKEEVETWQRDGVIEWWGWQDDMPPIYQQAFLVCLPSYREGLPTSLLEAASCGVPIITTNVPGCREVVRNGENGFLIPPRDAKALAESIMVAIDHPNLLVGMGARGRELMVKRYSQEIVNSETYKIYL